MTEYVWDKFLTERDKAVFAAGGFGATADRGKRPALLVIDVSWAFCGDKPEPPINGREERPDAAGCKRFQCVAGHRTASLLWGRRN